MTERPTMTWSQDKYNEIIDFAAVAHGSQKVPGKPYSYVVHLANVAMEVMTALAQSEELDADLAIACALLHDTIEDTATSAVEIEEKFGTAVRTGVEALTKNKGLPESEQMADSLDRILGQPREVGMAKMADRITNLQKPPDHWRREKIRAYYEEAQVIHKRLGHLHPVLSARLATRLERYTRYVDDAAAGAR
jgi:(p)ppGpp synthase/HD superfamily hydrolase